MNHMQVSLRQSTFKLPINNQTALLHSIFILPPPSSSHPQAPFPLLILAPTFLIESLSQSPNPLQFPPSPLYFSPLCLPSAFASYLRQIQYSYQFLVKRNISFLISLVMRLRHKKPLNPYKGQTNNDKNEFNDDDFKQQGSPHKKAANGSTDQIYKYAKILSKFIKTINQDYINYELLQGRQPNSTRMQCEDQPEGERLEIGVGTEHVEKQIKERKQITKIQARKQVRQEGKEHKVPSKKRQSSAAHVNARENQNKNVEQSAPNPTTLPKNSILPKNPSQAALKTEKEIKQIKPEPPATLNPNPPQSQLPTNSGFFGNPNPNPTNNFFNYIPPQALNFNPSNVLKPQQLLTMQMLRNMNPLQLRQQMGMHFPPMNVMPPSYVPLNMNMNMMAMMNMNFSNPQIRMMRPQPGEPINLFKEQLVVYNKKTQATESKNIRQTYPLKRSAYHVAIAYKIYLDKLKKEGNSFDQLQDIDPTKNARRIKSSQGQGSKTKDQKKKK